MGHSSRSQPGKEGKPTVSPTAVMVESEEGPVLIVVTPMGAFARRISDASSLATGVTQGIAAEDATRSAVEWWGLPDFVYQPVLRQLGSGKRELGDAILLVGQWAVVVQIKSREAPSDSHAREESWIRKNSLRALRQARGTVRALHSSPATLVNLRGREITIDGTKYLWLAVIVVDHPSVPEGVVIPNPNPDLPAVIILRRDWEFLFHHLRSSHAVVHYLIYCAQLDPIPLGEEPARYSRVALAAEEGPLDETERELVQDGVVESVPLFPLAAPSDGDLAAHVYFRIIMEDIAETELPEFLDEIDRLQILALLDQLPVAYRTDLGNWILSAWDRAFSAATEGSAAFRFRQYRLSNGYPHLIFGVCSAEASEFIQARFWGLVQLRHHEWGHVVGGVKDLTTIGILLTPNFYRVEALHPALVQPFDTILARVTGHSRLTPEQLDEIRRMWT